MTPGLIPYSFALLYGLAVGSFMNVCIFRIPEGRSIVSPPSACMSCGSGLKSYHNIPVFSYIALGGRCAFCGAKISMQYPLVELANGLLYVLAVYVFGLTLAAVGAMFAASVFFTGMMISFERSSVPVSVAVFALVISLPAGILCFGQTYAGVFTGLAAGLCLSALSGLVARQVDIKSIALFGGAAGAMTGPYGAASVCAGALVLWAVSLAGPWNTRRTLAGFTCIIGGLTVYMGEGGWIVSLRDSL